MKFLKKLFKNNKSIGKKVEIVDEYAHLPKCAYCHKPIFEYEKRKTFPKGRDGKKYHIKCWRYVLKEAKKMSKCGEINTLKYLTS